MRPYIIWHILIMSIFVASPTAIAKDCPIFIHGFTSDSDKYFGNLPRQVKWDSSKKLEDAAPEVAKKILNHSKSCHKDDNIILRAHSYGAAVSFYILGMGRRYQNDFPDHDFTKVYKMSTEFYSYTGAYSGTSVMDILCGSKLIRKISELFGKNCVPSLTTNSRHHPSEQITNPGVPTYLTYATNRGAFKGTIGAIIAMDRVPWRDWFDGKRNQNDSVLPQHSTRGCSTVKAMTEKEENCTKINSQYFKDFYWEKEMTHNELTKDEDFMLMEYDR